MEIDNRGEILQHVWHPLLHYSSSLHMFSNHHNVSVYQIISGQQLPKPKEQTKGEIVDPFVEIELLVPGVETVKYRTKTVNDNGFNPIWKEATDFTIQFEELSLVFLR